MKDKRFMELLAEEVQKLPREEQYAVLGTARGMSMMCKTQPAADKNPDVQDDVK